MRVTRSSQRALWAWFGVAVPVAGQAGVQVDGVRHHRRAEHRGGQQHALGALEARHQPLGGVGERWRLDEQAGQESDRDDQQQAADHPLERSLAAAVLHGEQQQRHRAGDDATDQQRQVEQQVQRDGAADDLGEIGCHGDQFGLQPVGDPGRSAGVVGDGFRQGAPADQSELGRQVLHESRHGVGQEDDPHQQEAELRARADVGRDIAGVDVGDGRDECRAEQKPTRTQPRLGVAQQLTPPFYPGCRIEKLG